MISVLVGSQSLELSSAEAVVREHTVNSDHHSSVSLLSHHVLVRNGLESADPACVPVVLLLLELSACENSLCAVDNDNVISAVYVGSVSGLVLASEDVSSLSSNSTKRLTLGIEDIPCTAYFSVVDI